MSAILTQEKRQKETVRNNVNKLIYDLRRITHYLPHNFLFFFFFFLYSAVGGCVKNKCVNLWKMEDLSEFVIWIWHQLILHKNNLLIYCAAQLDVYKIGVMHKLEIPVHIRCLCHVGATPQQDLGGAVNAVDVAAV